MNFKKISTAISIALLVIALVLCALPISVSAATGTVTYGSTKDYGTTGTLDQAIAAANGAPSTIYIKLNSNIELDGQLELGSSAKVELDLYGKTICLAASKTGGIFDVKGQLTISDSSANKTGKITGAIGAPAVSVSGSGTFTLVDGLLAGNNGGAKGGAVYVGVGSSFTMKGGKINNNNATGKGGGVYVEGNIFLTNDAVVQIVNNFEGGEISAGGVASGTVKSNLCLASGATIDVSELKSGSAIGVSANPIPSVGSPVSVTKATAKDLSSFFTTDNPNFGLIDVATTTGTGSAATTTHVLQLQARSIAFGEYSGKQLVSYVANSSTTRLKLELTTSGFKNTTAVSVKWCDSEGKALTTAPTGISATQSSPLKDGKVTLEFASTNKLKAGTYYYKVVIDGFESALNSFTVAATSITRNNETNYYLTLAEAMAAALNGDTVNILDSHTVTGNVYVSAKAVTLASSSAYTVTFADGGIVINGGGSLTMNGASSAKAVNFAGDKEMRFDRALIEVSGANSALILKNATISNGLAYNNGGAIHISGGAKAELTGVTIKNCSSDQGNGGAIYVGASSTLTLSGANISECSAVKGGAIYIENGATASVKASTTITKCKATSRISATADGGAIYNAGSLEVNSSTISSSSATSNGGAIYHEGSSLKITAASKITDCSATAYGGAIYLSAGTKLNINDTTVSGCSANAGEGVYMESAAVIDLFGRVVLDEIYMTSASNYLDVSGALSSDTFMSVYTAAHSTGATLVRSAGSYKLTANDAKRIRLSANVTSNSLKYVADATAPYVQLSNQAIAVGNLEGGELKRQTAASGLYYVGESYGIANGVKPTIVWYTDKYMTSSSSSAAPSGVTFTVEAINGGSFTIKVASSTTAKAGNYYFTVVAEGIESGLNTLTIKRSQIKKPSVSKVYTYTAVEQTLELDNFNPSIMSFVSGHKAKDVGTYSAVVAISDKTQYEWIDGTDTDLTISWMIERAKLTRPTVTIACTYKGAEQSPTINGWKDGIMEVTGNKQTKVGKYTLTVTLKDTKNYMWDNYSTGSITLDWEIKKATLIVKANDVNLVYGDAPKNNGVTYTTLLGSDTADVLKGTLVYTQNYTQGANAGTYTITPSGLTSDNYDIKFQAGSVIVDKKPVELVWSNVSFTYDGQAHIPSVAYKSYTGSEQLAVSGAQVKAGKYTATATGFENKNYKLANPTVEFEIKKVELTVKTGDAIITYGDPLSTINPGYTVTGFVSGEGTNVLGGTVVYNTNYVLYGDVGGAFTVTADGLTADNYTFKYESGNLSVKKRVVKVAADDIYSKDGSDEMTYKIVEGDFVNGDEKYLVLARTGDNTPGKYAIAGAFSNGNYEFTCTPASYYILRYAVEINGSDQGVSLESVEGIDPEIIASVSIADPKDYKKLDTEGKAVAVYKISFDKNGTKTAPEGTIKITLPIPVDHADEELVIKVITENGTATQLNTSVKDGYLVAEMKNVDANAAYAVYTLEQSNYLWFIIGGAVVLVAAGVGVFFIMKSRSDAAYDEDEDEEEADEE